MVADALAMRNGPNTTPLYGLPLNSQVIVWREKKSGKAGYWEGPFKLLSITGEDCVVSSDGNGKPRTFRSTSVRPYYDATEALDVPEGITVEGANTPRLPRKIVPRRKNKEKTRRNGDYTPERRGPGRPRKQAVLPERRKPGRPRKLMFLPSDDDALETVLVRSAPETNRASTSPNESATPEPGTELGPRPRRLVKRPERYNEPDISVFFNKDDETVFIEEDLDSAELFTTSTSSDEWKASRLKEVKGLCDKGVFRSCKKEDIPEGTRIFKCRFVDEIKNKGTSKEFRKSRLVIQAFLDSGKTSVLTQLPTI
jgi:hypothetical protein